MASSAPANQAPNFAHVAMSDPVFSERISRCHSTASMPSGRGMVSLIWPRTSRANVDACMRTASGPSSAMIWAAWLNR